MWLDHLPASVAFCDVETTGLGKHDRIVSFGGIGMISRDLAKGRPDLDYLYLVFDPGTGNRRGAEQIHGFSDSALRLQDPFAVHAADVWRFLTSYDLLVAHNAAFDIRFINREMNLSGLPALTRPVYCTMKGYRALDLGGSASLNAICQHIRFARAVPVLGREEDAADQVSAYMMLHLDKAEARRLIVGTSYAYKSEAEAATSPPTMKQFANAHGTPAQRFYNLLCIAYGADAQLFGDMVEKGHLPKDRADDCKDEYQQVAYAYEKLVDQHIDPIVAKTALDKNWLPDAEWRVPRRPGSAQTK